MLVIPTRDAETLRNSNALWPAGAWKGEFESFELRSLPRNAAGDLFKGYVGPDGEELSVHIGNNQPLEGQAEVGGQRQFLDITLRDGPYSLKSTPYEDIPSEAWKLQRSARLVANLAAALGQVIELSDGQLAVNDTFLDALASGVYKGVEIGYKIYHRKGKDGVVRPEIEMFIAA